MYRFYNFVGNLTVAFLSSISLGSLADVGCNLHNKILKRLIKQGLVKVIEEPY